MGADEAFWTLHDGLPKQGPGSEASTRRALGLLEGLPTAPRVLDLGCGPGRQTVTVARETGGRVVAVDLLKRFFPELRAAVGMAGLAGRVAPLRGSMHALPLADASFDLIWCEGAIYNVGFDAGLRAWRPLLCPGGGVAVSELCWLAKRVPERVRRFFASAYPAMRDHAENEAAFAAAGYRLRGSFVLPDADWEEGYYAEIEARIESLERQPRDPAFRAGLDAEREEIEVFRERRGCYGYVFYVGERVERLPEPPDRHASIFLLRSRR